MARIAPYRVRRTRAKGHSHFVCSKALPLSGIDSYGGVSSLPLTSSSSFAERVRTWKASSRGESTVEAGRRVGSGFCYFESSDGENWRRCRAERWEQSRWPRVFEVEDGGAD